MDTIGLDLHKRESQLCIAPGRRIGGRSVASSRAGSGSRAVLGNRSPARVLVEASTESEWVARYLEALGHDVIVADPNFAPMYATRSRRMKTDERDARTLVEACRLGAYRPAYRLSDERRHVRAELAVREALVRTRTRYIAIAKALVRRDGLRVAERASRTSSRKRIAALELSDTLARRARAAVRDPSADQRADRRGRSPDRGARANGSRRRAAGDRAERSGRSRRVRSWPRSTTSRAFARRISSKRFSGSSRASAARERNDGSGASRRPATRACGICWSRPAGAFSARRATRPRRCARGRSAIADASRQTDRRRGAGASTRRDSVRDVARRRAVRRRQASHAAAAIVTSS